MNNINKDEFNRLTIENQVEYVNKRLSEKSVTKICEDIGIDRSTVRKRFKKHNYIFDTDKNLYFKNPTDNIKKEVIKNDNNENSAPNSSSLKKHDGSINVAYIKGLETQLLDLKGKYEDIINLIKPPNTDIDNIPGDKFTIFDGEFVSRVYKIEENVQKDFKAYCRKYSDYRVQDIISTILKEYLEKNK